MASYGVLESDVKWPLLSVGKQMKSGAEVKFGSKGSWIDFHTDSGLQRVPVRVKGMTSGLYIQNTDDEIGREGQHPRLR